MAVRRTTARRRATGAGPYTPGELGRAYVAELDDFRPGVTIEDAQRAVAVRCGFVEAMLGDPRVIQLLTKWVGRLASNPTRFTTDDALPFVREQLGLRWPWCVDDILRAFHALVTGRQARGDGPIELEFELDAAVRAPALMFVFMTEEGEDVSTARARLTEKYQAALAELAKAEQAATGGRSARKTDHLQRWGRWFYEARVAAPQRSLAAIAAENHRAVGHPSRFDDCDCRKAVREGIRTAERLLSLSAYALPGYGGGKKRPR